MCIRDRYRTELKYGILDALQKGVEKTGQISWFIVKAIGKLLSGCLLYTSDLKALYSLRAVSSDEILKSGIL